MAQEKRSARRSPAPGGDPAFEASEADAAEQRAPVGDDDVGDEWNGPSEESLDQAAEADVVEQAQDAGADDDERR